MLYTYLHDDILLYLWKKAVNASMKRLGGKEGREKEAGEGTGEAQGLSDVVGQQPWDTQGP